MTASRKRRRLWSYTAGVRPHSVHVFERVKGGVLYVKAWNPNTRSQTKRSLGHRDREQAIRYAEDEAKKLRDGLQAIAPRATVGSVLQAYLLNRTPRKSGKSQRQEDERRAGMWLRVLGYDRKIQTLGAPEWHGFIADRMSGVIDANGKRVSDPKARKEVTPRTVDADLVFLNTVFNWACTWNPKGRALLEKNPWGATSPGVKRSLARPKTTSPKRPIASYDRYEKLVAAAVEISATKKGAYYFPTLLELAEQTGRRISAVCRLAYSDVVRKDSEVFALRWRAIKGEKTHEVPVSMETRATIERLLRERPGVGDTPMFPAPKDRKKPMSRWLARDWLEEAEKHAGLDHLDGGAWHPYRRKWATERKGYPTIDVMDAGGWKDDRSLKGSYQQADRDTVLAVVNEPRKLREKKA